MSSQDVALYLCELGSNQRKLEYCRQILAQNPYFVPEAVFNLNFQQPKNTLSKKQFLELIQSLNISCNEQEKQLIFLYFQIDGKNYITYDQFRSVVVPETDSSLKNIISRRRADQFNLDYALRFALQKLFFQIIENQVKLEIMCKFTFEKGREGNKIRAKKIDFNGLKQFLAHHGKYPSENILKFIVKDIGLNKGENKRNKLIVQYMLQFNQKKKSNTELPKVFTKDILEMAQLKNKYQKQNFNQENTLNKINLTKKQTKFDFSQNSPINPLLKNSFNNGSQKSNVRQNVNSNSNNMYNVDEAENRINSLLSTISIKQTKSPNQQKSVSKQNSTINPTVQALKDQIKKQKQQSSKNFEIEGFNKNSKYSDLIRENEKAERQKVKSYTDRNEVDRFTYQKNRKVTEQNFESESNSSSQVVFRPRSKIAAPSSLVKSSEKIKQFEKQSKNNEQKQKNGNRNRLHYLKSLIQQNSDSKSRSQTYKYKI